jgi:WD40 repeat protein/serine/threonine protein kinase
MSAERKDEEAIFKAAIKLKTPAEREAYLKGACGNNAELLSRLEVLLKAHDEAGDFLEVPPFDPNATLNDSPLSEGPGTVIGRYKLLEKIGEGGMAVVYMAEQKRPIRRKVALKIIKLGMDTKSVIARFEAERQALALMDHPNIARVLDAGSTDTGRPYFVMELVRGISITEYCDKNDFSTKERLELFISVCSAVQHAHQKGIIHRDIKPSNVMVTLHDGEPLVKVIDFGIAKATNQQLTEKTLFTRYAQMIGTPVYMSPEQAEMSTLDIDTRTDVYSLGVLLYELLTGATPFDAEKLNEAGYGEIQRIIREEEPPRPSTKLSTLGKDLTDIAKHRHSNPDLLPQLIRGDLDWIVMKTMEKNRNRRYDTAAELATDIERHLNNEPVHAASPSLLYRTQKFVRRNRVWVITTAAVVVVIMAGFITTTVMYLQYKKMYVRSETMRVKAEEAGEKEVAARIKAEDAGKKEVAARIEAEQAKEVAQQQRQRAEGLLAKSQLERGIKLLNEGNCLGLLDLLDAGTTADEIPVLRDSVARLWAIGYELWRDRLVDIMPNAQNLAFSPDGRLLATSNGRSAQLWNMEMGKPHGPPLQLEKVIGAVVFSPDGKLLVTHSIEGEGRLWKTDTAQPAGPILLHGSGTTQFPFLAYWSAAFSPDSKLLATTGLDGTARLWITDTGQPFSGPLRHEGEVWNVAFSPDGKLLASGSRDGTARLWRVDTAEAHAPPLEHGAGVTSLEFSPDGKLLATTSYSRIASLWKVDSGQLFKQLSQPEWNKDIAFNPEGNLVATASRAWMAQFWETTTGRMHGEPLRHGAGVNILAFTPDGRLLVTGSVDQTVRLWEVAEAQPYGPPLHHQHGIGKMEFSPDGKLLATTGFGRVAARIWRTCQPLRTELVPENKGTRFGAVSADGKVGAIIIENTVYLWDTTKVKKLGEGLRHDSKIMKVLFSPSGRLLATVAERTVYLWDLSTGQIFGHALDTDDRARTLAFSPDGTLLATGSHDSRARVFDVATGRRLHMIGCAGSVGSVAFRPDGNVLVTGSADGVVQQWDITTGKEFAPLLRHELGFRAVAYSPDGSLLATASGVEKGNKTIRLWDIANGPPYHSLTLPFQVAWEESPLDSFTSDGMILVDKSGDGSVRIWRLPAVPVDLREMEVRTWVAIVAKKQPDGEAVDIQQPEWRKLRDELRLYDNRVPQASRPQPTNGGDAGVKSSFELTWISGLDAVAHNVYFGTNPEKMRLLGTVKKTSFTDLPKLEKHRWYCWQVDTVKSDGSVTKGNLWNFCTGNIVAWWKFDQAKGDEVADSSGNGLSGRFVGDANIIADSERGSVLKLDGDGDYVDCGNSPVFDITDEISTTAWVKIHSVPQDWTVIVAKGNSAWRLSTAFGDRRFHFAVSKWAGEPVGINGDITIAASKWHHVCGTCDGANLRLYVDGIEDTSSPQPYSGTVGTNGYNVYIGENAESLKCYWDGFIDDVRIYSYALSQEEIKAVYKGRGPGPLTRPRWVGDVSEPEFVSTIPEIKESDIYYLPLRSELEYNEAKQSLLKKREILEITRLLFGDEDPNITNAMMDLAREYYRWAMYDQVQPLYTKALEIRRRLLGEKHPDTATSLNSLAWLWATCPEEKYRNGTKAIEYATKACEFTTWENAMYVDTLAAAYAEAGDFDEAMKWQKKAIELLTEKDPAEWRIEFTERLELYQSGKAYRQSQ